MQINDTQCIDREIVCNDVWIRYWDRDQNNINEYFTIEYFFYFLHWFQVFVWLFYQIKYNTEKTIDDQCNEFTTIVWTTKNNESQMNQRWQ